MHMTRLYMYLFGLAKLGEIVPIPNLTVSGAHSRTPG